MSQNNYTDINMEDFSEVYDFIKEIGEKEMEKLKTVNILVAGNNGVGKSTVINEIFGKKVAKVGTGRPVTQQITKYESDTSPITIYDTKGFEVEDGNQIIEDLRNKILSLRDSTTGGRANSCGLALCTCSKQPDRKSA